MYDFRYVLPSLQANVILLPVKIIIISYVVGTMLTKFE